MSYRHSLAGEVIEVIQGGAPLRAQSRDVITEQHFLW